MKPLSKKTVVISGGSRGIGEAIALRAARDGANVAILAKTDKPHPKLPGTIHTTAEAIENQGGQSLPLCVDIRDEQRVVDAIAQVVEVFGGIDIVVNNASAIQLTGTLETPMKRFDLMHAVNVRGTFLLAQCCLPHLIKAENPHMVMLSPPLNMEPRWFKNHVAYTMSKYGMSMCVLGMAEEFRDQGVAVNALWPKTGIATAAIYMLGGDALLQQCRKPEIVADAWHALVTKPSREWTGQFCVDEELLQAAGVSDFSQYAFDPHGKQLMPDFFL